MHMKKIVDLKSYFGLPVQIDLNSNKLISSAVSCTLTKHFTADSLRQQLMNKDISADTHIYTKFIQIDDDEILAKKGLRLNLYSIPAGLTGVEYYKTRASKTNGYPKILETLYGTATLLLFQHTRNGDVLIVTKVTKGKKVVIPPQYSLTIINTRNSHLLVKEVYTSNVRHHYVLDEMNGMPYYVIRKNGKQEFVRNPTFKEVKLVKKVNWPEILKQLNLTEKTPALKQVLRKNEQCKWLFEQPKEPISLI